MCPSTDSGWIGQTCRVFAVRCGLLGRITGGDVLTGLLPAVNAVVSGRRQPIGQDGKGLPARLTDSAPHPDTFVLVIVTLAPSPAVADDGVSTANGTSPRQQAQRNHPGSVLSSASGSAIKRITAGVRAAADRPCQSFDLRPAFTLPVKSVSNEKRILLSGSCRYPSLRTLAGFQAFFSHVTYAVQVPFGAWSNTPSKFVENGHQERAECTASFSPPATGFSIVLNMGSTTTGKSPPSPVIRRVRATVTKPLTADLSHCPCPPGVGMRLPTTHCCTSTGPKFRASQSRISRMTSWIGGMCPLSNCTCRFCPSGVPSKPNSGTCDAPGGYTKS